MIHTIEDFSDYNSVAQKAKLDNGEFITVLVTEQISSVQWSTAEGLFRLVDALRKNVKTDFTSQNSLYRERHIGKLSDFKRTSGEKILTMPESSIMTATIQYDENGNKLEWVRNFDTGEGDTHNLAGLTNLARLETFDTTFMAEHGTPDVKKHAAEVLRIFGAFDVK